MSSWLNDSQERKLLAETLHEKHLKAKSKQDAANAAAEAKKIDDKWKTSCEDGKHNGKVRLCWVDLKNISDRIYTFQSDYGRELQELVMDGIGLSSLGDICKQCTHLKHLSLASNNIKDISGIDNLRGLTRLNLLRNNLTRLPASIGILTNLTRLDLANNQLTQLPGEFGQLSKLTHLNLESNELCELPLSFGKLKCEIINLNSNSFAVFPDCVLGMSTMKQLSIMANQLSDLPVAIGSMKNLEIFRASKNRIMIIPDSIVNLPLLHTLWLDFNRISALPRNFHRLQRLKVIKLEGNHDMIYPPLEIVALGSEEVLRYSRSRLESSNLQRVRSIVQSLEEVLSLVKKHRIGGDLHDSLFQVDDDCYIFPPDALWSTFIPELRKMWSRDSANDGIKSFPFERTEVEQAIFQFRDAAGSIVKRLPNARFTRCSCVSTGRNQVCIPPQYGFMCSRPALAIRMKVAYEENMREKRRVLEENRRIDDAVRGAKANAKSFLASEDGMIFVREEAEKTIALQKQKPTTGLTSKTSSNNNKSISNKIISSAQIFRSQFGRDHNKTELRRAEEDVKAEYINDEVEAARDEVVERNSKVRDIMQNWQGVTIDEVFKCWRQNVESSKRLQRREKRQVLRDERLHYEDKLATFELQKLEFAAWEEHWDEFNEAPIWMNVNSNETRCTPPPQPLVPLMPASIINSSTGQPFTVAEIRQNEADTSISEEDSVDDVESRNSDEREKSNSIPPPPLGLHSEIELAEKRVKDIRMMRMGY